MACTARPWRWATFAARWRNAPPPGFCGAVRRNGSPDFSAVMPAEQPRPLGAAAWSVGSREWLSLRRDSGQADMRSSNIAANSTPFFVSAAQGS